MGEKLASLWYFGGLASAGATCVTHPLDLIKVHLQTQHRGSIGVAGTAVRVISVHGFMALYNGLSASLCRQLMYSATRFAIYDSLRNRAIHDQKKYLLFYEKVYMAAIGGFVGGFLGSPADMVNVRMQNDVKVPVHLRRNYSHVLNGMTRVIQEEGFLTLFSGVTMASVRGALMTVGQASCYYQIKELVLTLTSFSDGLRIHIIASFIAGLCATILCQPLDVIKTRMMSAQDYDGIIHCVSKTAKLGPLAFYKGTVPAAIRLIPHTILTFVFLEQLRINFGIPVESDLGQD
ncbi:mitochondrial dicarboxylate carrier-like [Trichosurus vulpecula]|uniref:mitochondrial dicarboxylate carrier-like n=1 Tax=Trichosurus vulpecula TaxID=9337 RepID=UPI00186B0B04|nr:mitochondrial dicarboxylate carrier-like [Trichosurus vulpecula]